MLRPCVLAALLLTAADADRLHIGAVFPMLAEQGGWAGGQACLPAAQMALDDVNGHSHDVLGGHELVLHQNDSQCQPGLGAKVMYELLYNPPTKLMLLSGCSLVTTIIAEAAVMWNLLVLSYGASSPALSNKERFPTLFRTHPSAIIHNPTRVALFQRFRWSKVAILQSVEEVFTTTAKDLERTCRTAGIHVVSRQTFSGNPADAVNGLKRHDARIIVGLFYEKEARKVFCEVYKAGLYGEKYVWFLIGWYSNEWFIPPKDEKINCTDEEMLKAANYHFTTEALLLSRDETPGISGYTGLQFQQRLDKKLGLDDDRKALPDGYVEAPLSYDAIWAVAVGFNCTMDILHKQGLSLNDFTYENEEVAKIMLNCMKNVKFHGVSGFVQFSGSGDRIAKTQVEQLQVNATRDGKSEYKYELMGIFDSDTKQLEWLRREKFQGRTGPPPDATIVMERLLTVSAPLYWGVVFLCAVGILSTVACVYFNWKYQVRYYVQQSQPQVNNLMAAGCALCFVSLALYGLPVAGISIDKSMFTIFCHGRLSLLSVGFTLAYGSMFAKVWVVHRLGANEQQQLAVAAQKEQESDAGPLQWDTLRTFIATMVGGREVATRLRKLSTSAYMNIIGRRMSQAMNQPIPVTRFLSVVGLLLAVDFAIIAIWMGADPMTRTVKHFPRETAQQGGVDDIELQPILELCQSRNHIVWTGLTFAYKGVLLVFGLFLAYEGRNLKLRYVNDTRWVSLAVYNVALLSMITAPIAALLIRAQHNANFIFVSTTVMLCAWISLGLVFVPKLHYVARVPASSKEDGTPTSRKEALRKLTKAEMDLCERLLVENEQLQRQIAAKEARIAQVRKRLELRLAERATPLGDGESTVSHRITTLAAVEPPPPPEDSSGYRSGNHGVTPSPILLKTPHADVQL